MKITEKISEKNENNWEKMKIDEKKMKNENEKFRRCKIFP